MTDAVVVRRRTAPKSAQQPVESSQWFTVGAKADRNKKHRRQMEDRHVVESHFNGADGWGLFCVFDGHRGAKAADVLCAKYAQILIDALGPQIFLDASLKDAAYVCDALVRSFAASDDAIVEAGEKNAGCTAAVALVVPHSPPFDTHNKDNDTQPSGGRTDRDDGTISTLYSANVGDAGILVCTRKSIGGDEGELTANDNNNVNNGIVIRRLHECHTTDSESECAEVEARGGVLMNGRINGLINITRTLGDMNLKPFVSPVPHTSHMGIVAGKSYIVLGCDGIWDVLSDDDIVSIAEANDDNSFDVNNACMRVVDAALTKGSTDNLSCVIATIN